MIKNWQEKQDNPRFKPTLNLRKVDRNDPNLRNQLEKLKADREERVRKTNKEYKSAASSVEFLDEVIHITGQPVTQEPGTEENDRSGSPLTPLARGWVPLYTGTETPQASGEEPTSGEEPPKDGEMSPSKDSSPRQQTVTLESGECTPSSDDPQSDQSYVIEFPSDYEGIRSQDYKRTLRTDWGRALQKTNMKKSGSGAHGSKDENQKTMIISNSWLIN